MFPVIFLILSSLLLSCHALIHHLTINHDSRNVFKIETFGFLRDGVINVTISDFNFHLVTIGSNNSHASSGKFMDTTPLRKLISSNKKLNDSNVPSFPMGFLMRHADSESEAQEDLETIVERGVCIFDKKQKEDIFIDLTNPKSWKKSNLYHVISSDEHVGFYTLIYAHCLPSGYHGNTRFKLDADFYNPGPNYLSAGDTYLPLVYFLFFLLFSLSLGLWIWTVYSSTNSGPTSSLSSKPVVNHIHHMMTVLLAFKCLSLFFESVRYHYIAIYGVSETWSMVYFFFATLKGIMLFTVILLIGSGYSLMKNYLNDNEKRIIFVVLILQVLDNIAMVIIEDSAPGSQSWLAWKDILHLVDIICCLAILLPIVWSIRHLRQAAEVDGKAQNNLSKLTLFRQFYISVVVYIYFTRIAVYLLTETVPFYLLWLGPVFDETAALIFYISTGFKFKPAVDNPYLPVHSEDSEGSEYGLRDDDELITGIEMSMPKLSSH